MTEPNICSPFLQSLSEDAEFTCDWGDCDHVSVVERWSEHHGWLPVCGCHIGGAACQR